jgi:hypothetical protein
LKEFVRLLGRPMKQPSRPPFATFQKMNYLTFDSGARRWQTFRAMPRKRDPDDRTPREEIAAVITWAQRQGFTNIADALQRALDRLNYLESERRS